MKLNQFINAANYQICGGSEHQWKCYPNGQFLDIADSQGNDIGDCVYDRVTHTVFEVTVYNGTDAFLWIDPAYRNDVDAEHTARGVNPDVVWDDVKFVRIDSEAAILLLVKKYATGDSRVVDAVEQAGRGSCDHCTCDTVADESVTPISKLNMAEYNVIIDVRYTFSVTADSMESATVAAKEFTQNMKPALPSNSNVCWMDTYPVQESVSRQLVAEIVIE